MAPSHRSSLSVRSTFKRKRRSASRRAILARWKKVSTPSSPRKPANDRVVGARVIDLRCLSKGIEELSKHNVDCRGKCTIAREVSKMGLASILELVCDTCAETFHIKASPKISGSAEINQRYNVNVGPYGVKCLQVGGRN